MKQLAQVNMPLWEMTSSPVLPPVLDCLRCRSRFELAHAAGKAKLQHDAVRQAERLWGGPTPLRCGQLPANQPLAERDFRQMHFEPHSAIARSSARFCCSAETMRLRPLPQPRQAATYRRRSR